MFVVYIYMKQIVPRCSILKNKGRGCVSTVRRIKCPSIPSFMANLNFGFLVQTVDLTLEERRIFSADDRFTIKLNSIKSR